VRLSSRRADDADVIRARLRALLADTRTGGWVPGHDDPDADPDDPDDFDGAGPRDDAVDRALREPADEDLDSAAGDGRPVGMGRHRAPAPTARLDPGRAGARALWAAALLAVAVLLAWTWLDRPQVEPAPDGAAGSSATSPVAASEPAPSAGPATPSAGEVAQTATTVVVAVVGEVERPGLVTLPTGSRVADAIEAAGGLLPEADPASVNLAAVVADGQQVAIGVPGAPDAGPAPPDGGAASPTAGAGAGDGSVDVNTAPATELDTLPGIGPVLAQRIVEHREQVGPFRSVDQLQDVAGIGPTVLERIAERVRV
jgi:competence protein ComEA